MNADTIGAIIVVIAFILFSIFLFSIESRKIDCRALAVFTDLETRYQITTGCQAQIGGIWVPAKGLKITGSERT